MHYDSACTKISANSGVDQGCPLSTCGFSAAVDPYFGQFLRTSARSTTRAPTSLPTWTTCTCGSNRSTYCRQLLPSQQPPDQSTLPYSPPRHRSLAGTPFHLSSKTRSRSHSVALVDIYKFMATSSPALLLWESRPPWRRQYNAFRKLPPHLQTSILRISMRRQWTTCSPCM